MPARLGVQILGDEAGLTAALGRSVASTNRWATDTEGAAVRVTESFKGVSTAALQLQVAQDKLAISTNRYGLGTSGAAAATVAYRRQVDALAASHIAAARSIGRGLTTYVTAPTALLGYAAVKASITFQQEMLKIQTQAGASAAEVKNLSGQVLDLAKVAPQGPAELAEGLFHLESLGLRGANAMRALGEASIAAGASGANLEDVTTALGGAVVTGIRGVENYHEAMAGLVAIAGEGNMRMQDLTAALGTGVLPAAKNAGVSLREVGAALAVLTDRGMSAEMAGTRLRMTFALMQHPSGAAKKALDDLGIGSDQMAKMLQQPDGLLHVLQLLHDRMDAMGKVRGSKDILGAFGGGRSGAGILTLVQSVDSAVSSYQSKLIGYDQGVQKATKNMADYQQSDSYKLHTAASTIEADMIRLGSAISPAIITAAGTVAKLADAFTALPGPVKREVGVIVGVLAVGGPLILAVAGVVKAVRSIGLAFGLLPAEAAPGIAATGAELETGIGGAVVATEARVATLRASLLGLGALAIAPIVIPVEYDYAKSKYNPLRGPLESLGASLAGSGSPGPSGPGHAGFAKAIADARAIVAQYGPPQDAGMAERQAAGKLMQRYPSIAADQWATIWRIASQPAGPATGNAAADQAARTAKTGTSAGTTTVAGSSSTPAPSPNRPSRATEVALALARNPDDRAAIESKLSYDAQAAAFAEKLINSGRLTKKQLDDRVRQLEAIYGDEASLRSQLKSLDTAAQKSTFALPMRLQIAQAQAQTTPGTGDDQRANAAVAAYIRHKLPGLHGANRLTALQDLASVTSSTAGFSVPMGLQLQLAKAQASGNAAKVTSAEEAIKTKVEEMLHSGKRSIQFQIDAYNELASLNGDLGTASKGTSHFASLASLTRGITDPNVRKAVEARIAQAQAHSGHTPTGNPATYITVNGGVHAHGVQDVNGIVEAISEHGMRGAASRRGSNAGHYLGRH